MKRFRSFRRLTSHDRSLLLRAFVSLAYCWLGLRVRKFKNLQAWAKSVGNGVEPIDRLVWAVCVAARFMPNATCLCQALALQRMLSNNSYKSELRIGVDKSDGHFSAHAWLVHDGEALIGGGQLDKYEVLVAWKAQGDLAGVGT